MKITYANRKIEKVCTNHTAAVRAHGVRMAEKIAQCIFAIAAAETVESLVKRGLYRCHALKQDRKGQYAMDLVHPYRLVFEIHGEEIEIANILEVIDYH